MWFHMLFLKSKSSHIATVEINIYEVEWQQEGICSFYTILIVAMGLGTCSFPGMRVGRQAECLAGITLFRALCLLHLFSYPSWSCSAFSTSHRKARLFECMGNNSLTHWCWKYKLITGGEKCFASWVFFGQSVHDMKQPAPSLPFATVR